MDPTPRTFLRRVSRPLDAARRSPGGARCTDGSGTAEAGKSARKTSQSSRAAATGAPLRFRTTDSGVVRMRERWRRPIERPPRNSIMLPSARRCNALLRVQVAFNCLRAAACAIQRRHGFNQRRIISRKDDGGPSMRFFFRERPGQRLFGVAEHPDSGFAFCVANDFKHP